MYAVKIDDMFIKVLDYHYKSHAIARLELTSDKAEAKRWPDKSAAADALDDAGEYEGHIGWLLVNNAVIVRVAKK